MSDFAKKIDKDKLLCILEGLLMLVLAVVLGFVRIAALPLGGSVTLVALFPIAIHSYRWFNSGGFGKFISVIVALIFALVQILLSLGRLSSASDAGDVVIRVIFGYILSYGIFGISGIFRGRNNKALIAVTSVLGVVFTVVYTSLFVFSDSEKLASSFDTAKWLIIIQAALLVLFTVPACIFKNRIHQSGFGMVAGIAACYAARVVFCSVSTFATVDTFVISDIPRLTYSLIYNMSYLIPEAMLSIIIAVAFCAILDMDAQALNVRMKDNPVLKDK